MIFLSINGSLCWSLQQRDRNSNVLIDRRSHPDFCGGREVLAFFAQFVSAIFFCGIGGYLKYHISPPPLLFGKIIRKLVPSSPSIKAFSAGTILSGCCHPKLSQHNRSNLIDLYATTADGCVLTLPFGCGLPISAQVCFPQTWFLFGPWLCSFGFACVDV